MKPKSQNDIRIGYLIEEKIPLKQGLKHMYCLIHDGLRRIEEKIPLKQGLKQKDEALKRKDQLLLKRRFH